MKKWIIPVAIVVLLGMMFISGYNSLVAIRENVDGRWSQVENQLQRRADLIPNLVETVKGFAAKKKAFLSKWLKPGRSWQEQVL